MWIVNTLRKKFYMGDTEINVETDDIAGYLAVYKTKKMAIKQAKEFGCGVTEISLEPQQDKGED